MRRGSQHQVRSAPFRVCVTAVGAESEDVVVSASCSARGAKLSVLSTAYVKTEHLALNCGTPFRASFDGLVHRRLCRRLTRDLLARRRNGEGRSREGGTAQASTGYTIAKDRARLFSDHPEFVRQIETHLYPGLRKAGILEK